MSEKELQQLRDMIRSIQDRLQIIERRLEELTSRTAPLAMFGDYR